MLACCVFNQWRKVFLEVRGHPPLYHREKNNNNTNKTVSTSLTQLAVCPFVPERERGHQGEHQHDIKRFVRSSVHVQNVQRLGGEFGVQLRHPLVLKPRAVLKRCRHYSPDHAINGRLECAGEVQLLQSPGQAVSKVFLHLRELGLNLAASRWLLEEP